MAFRNKSLSLTCAPDLKDIDTYFCFEKKYFDLISEYVLQRRILGGYMASPEISKSTKDPFFSKKIVGVFISEAKCKFDQMRI